MNVLYTYKPDSDTFKIEDWLIDDIILLIAEEYYKDDPTDFDFPKSEMKIEINWVIKSKDGALTKRIGRWYYNTFKKSISNKITEKIGNLIGNYVPKVKEYHYDITQDYNWKVGEFGDIGSCFFNGNGYFSNQGISTNSNLYALRFFKENKKVFNRVPRNAKSKYVKDDKYYTGLSRAWLYQYDTDKDIIFNAYGYKLDKVASIFAKATDREVKKVSLHGDVYINGDIGYLVGKNIDKEKTSYEIKDDNDLVEKPYFRMRGIPEHIPDVRDALIPGIGLDLAWAEA